MKPSDRAPGGGRKGKPPEGGGQGCPICGKPRTQAYRPFCSSRCADIDLGRWLEGRYAVPGEPAHIDQEGSGGASEDG